MIAYAADVTKRTHGLGGVIQQGPLESRIGPGFGNNLGAIVGTDFGFVGLDDGIERGRIDIAFLGQHGLERAHAQFGLGQFRMVMVVVIVVVAGHGLRIAAIFCPCRGGDSASVCTWGFREYA